MSLTGEICVPDIQHLLGAGRHGVADLAPGRHQQIRQHDEGLRDEAELSRPHCNDTNDLHVYFNAFQGANLSRMKLVEGPEGELFISVPIASKAKKLPQYYCFSTGRHSGSFFLKMGAAFFSLGHIVHVGLLLGKQVT